MTETISFIGGGNMARSLLGGLTANGYPRDKLCASDPDATQRSRLEHELGVSAVASNDEALARGDTVVLAVKPQVLREVVISLAPGAQNRRPLFLSIAAGVRSPDILGWLGYDAAIVRSMPNTPALVRCGASALFANPRVNATQRAQAESVLAAVGMTLWVEREDLLDAVTAVSGSGPAYFFLLMELVSTTGEALGLSPEMSRRLTIQTALGAAKMALESGDDPATLRANVTSPGGTTERALAIMRDGKMGELVRAALTGARDRAVELADLLGER